MNEYLSSILINLKPFNPVKTSSYNFYIYLQHGTSKNYSLNLTVYLLLAWMFTIYLLFN